MLVLAVVGIGVQANLLRQGFGGAQTRIVLALYVLIALYAALSLYSRRRKV